MPAFEDLTGQRFGRLTVLYRGPNQKTRTTWICQCDCGNITRVQSNGLKSGRTKSCGCYNIDSARRRATKHDCCKTRLYKIWQGIKKRCNNSAASAFRNYGGRGITMCDEWQSSFETFRDWALTHGYQDDLTIDRIDVNGNYAPENCRWATVKQQCNNQRDNHVLYHDGQSHTMSEWADITGILYTTLRGRINGLQWDTDAALTIAPNENGWRHIPRGEKPVICLETQHTFPSLKQAAQWCGISSSHLSQCCHNRHQTAGGYHWEYAQPEVDDCGGVCS